MRRIIIVMLLSMFLVLPAVALGQDGDLFVSDEETSIPAIPTSEGMTLFSQTPFACIAREMPAPERFEQFSYKSPEFALLVMKIDDLTRIVVKFTPDLQTFQGSWLDFNGDGTTDEYLVGDLILKQYADPCTLFKYVMEKM